MSDAAVLVKLEDRPSGRIARVTVDNARKLNCLSTPLIVQLTQAFVKLADDQALRAVVLTGSGDRAFIGGADLNELGGLCADSARLYITRLHGACKAIRDCPVPVIGRVNGFCLGAGLEVAASCDFRAAADTAQFGMPEVVMGLPSVIEAALLPGLVGWGRTREMLLTGAMFSAAEALAMGFVQKAVPADELDAAVEPLARRHLPRDAPGRALAEDADESLATRFARGGRPRRHRCPVRCLHHRGTAGCNRRISRGEGEEKRGMTIARR